MNAVETGGDSNRDSTNDGLPEPTELDALLAAARWGALRPDADVIERLQVEIKASTSPRDEGALWLCTALALQGGGDVAAAAAAARKAVTVFHGDGAATDAAYASAVAAVLVGQGGDLGTGVELAVDALLVLGDSAAEDETSVRAALALSAFFFQQSAFDLAIDLAERAFEGAHRLGVEPIDAVAYNLGYFAVEAANQTTGDEQRDARIAHVSEAVRWLSGPDRSAECRAVLGPGLAAEVSHVLGIDSDPAALDAGASAYADLAPDLVAWHRLVRAVAHHRGGNPREAIDLLDEAVPVFVATTDSHCLVRALTVRSAARAAIGDAGGALADAVELARFCRSWQLDQAVRLADQVTRRVDVERTRLDVVATNRRLRAAVEQHAVAANERGALIAAIGHDLGSPLSSVQLAADILLTSTDLAAGERALLSRLRDEARHAGDLVGDLTSAGRLASHAAQPQRVHIDLRRVAAASAGRFGHLGHTVCVEAVPPGSTALGDPVLVSRMLDNLVSNAAKYVTAPSVIEIGAEVDGEFVLLSVDDEGPGLPESLRESAFELYLRGENASATSGHGVGLYLVRTFAEMQGGRAWWEPSRRGGSRFVVSLPR